MPAHRPPIRPKTPTEHAIAALGELHQLAAEIDERTQHRQILIVAAYRNGARLTDIATATGLSRSMVARMTGARR